MGTSLQVSCSNCDLDQFLLIGTGFAGIEKIPVICRNCADVTNAERKWVAPGTDQQVHDDPPLVCDGCSSPVEELVVSEDQSGKHTIESSCPACGHDLLVSDGMFTVHWD